MWGSALSTGEFAAIRSVGFEPVGQVLLVTRTMGADPSLSALLTEPYRMIVRKKVDMESRSSNDSAVR
jgi:hypothetical protein